MSGDNEQETQTIEKIPLTPPVKRRDYHLRMSLKSLIDKIELRLSFL